MHRNVESLISLHQKRPFSLLFKKVINILDRKIIRNNNLHYQRAWSVASFLGLRLRVLFIQKSTAIVFDTQSPPN